MSKKSSVKKSNGFVFVSVSNVIEKLECCNEKEKTTNNLLIDMLENTNLESVKIEVSRGGGFNRGSLVECIVKNTILNYLGFNAEKVSKSNNLEKDLNLAKRNKELLSDLKLENKDYEIKLITSLARASAISPLNQVENIIIIDLRNKSKGAYLVNKKDLVLYELNQSIKDYKKGVYLDLLTELLGLE